MTRNLNRRVEIACPIEDPELCQMLQEILTTELADNVKASSLQPDGSYFRKSNATSHIDSQATFMEHSLHKPALVQKKPDGGVKPNHLSWKNRFLGLFSGVQKKK